MPFKLRLNGGKTVTRNPSFALGAGPSRRRPKRSRRAANHNPARQVAAPVSLGNTGRIANGATIIRQNTRADSGVTVTHREYLGEVAAAGSDFTLEAFPVNPGMARSFPWLSTIARRFEKYRFRNLEFQFVTEQSTAASGRILMAADYNPSDGPPPDKQTLLSYEHAVGGSVWLNSRLPVTHPSTKFVRSGAEADSIKLYDQATVFVGTSGVSAGVQGELYVSYSVDLLIPQIGPDDAPFASIINASASNDLLSGGTLTTNESITLDATGTLTLGTTGKYLVVLRFDEDSAVLVDAPYLSGNAIVTTNFAQNPAVQGTYAGNAGNFAGRLASFVVEVTTPGETIKPVQLLQAGSVDVQNVLCLIARLGRGSPY